MIAHSMFTSIKTVENTVCLIECECLYVCAVPIKALPGVIHWCSKSI